MSRLYRVGTDKHCSWCCVPRTSRATERETNGDTLLQAQGSTFDGGAAGQRHDQKETKERRIDRAGRVLLCVPLPLPYLQICATVPCTRCVARASSITIEASVARKRPESAHGASERQCWREEQATRRM